MPEAPLLAPPLWQPKMSPDLAKCLVILPMGTKSALVENHWSSDVLSPQKAKWQRRERHLCPCMGRNGPGARGVCGSVMRCVSGLGARHPKLPLSPTPFIHSSIHSLVHQIFIMFQALSWVLQIQQWTSSREKLNNKLIRWEAETTALKEWPGWCDGGDRKGTVTRWGDGTPGRRRDSPEAGSAFWEWGTKGGQWSWRTVTILII